MKRVACFFMLFMMIGFVVLESGRAVRAEKGEAKVANAPEGWAASAPRDEIRPAPE